MVPPCCFILLDPSYVCFYQPVYQEEGRLGQFSYVCKMLLKRTFIIVCFMTGMNVCGTNDQERPPSCCCYTNLQLRQQQQHRHQKKKKLLLLLQHLGMGLGSKGTNDHKERGYSLLTNPSPDQYVALAGSLVLAATMFSRFDALKIQETLGQPPRFGFF